LILFWRKLIDHGPWFRRIFASTKAKQATELRQFKAKTKSGVFFVEQKMDLNIQKWASIGYLLKCRFFPIFRLSQTRIFALFFESKE
jgi:hypothetical protein